MKKEFNIARPKQDNSVIHERYFHCLTDLPLDTLHISMEYLGAGHYRLVAGTCCDLSDLYCEVDPKRQTTWKNAAASSHCAELCYRDHEECNRKEALELIAESAAANGNMDVIRWAHKRGIVWTPTIGTAAASHGHLPVLKLLKRYCYHCPSQRLSELPMEKSNGYGAWNMESLGAAAFSGHLDCVRFLHEGGCHPEKHDSGVCERAAEGGQLDILRHFHSHDFTFGVKVTEAAGRGGQLDTLKYLQEEAQCEYNYQACCAAAGAGHIEVVHYLHQLGCTWNSTTFRSAMESGHVEIVRYLFENGCELPVNHFITICLAIECGHVDILQYLLLQTHFDVGARSLCQKAIETGKWEIVQCFREHWDGWTFKCAVESGQLEIVRKLFENGCEHYRWVLMSAVKSGHVKIVRYLFQNGCGVTSQTISAAIESGNLEITRYLFENDCLHDSWVLMTAVKSGHLHIVRYLRDNAFAWKSWMFWFAIESGHVEMVRYLLDDGCPYALDHDSPTLCAVQCGHVAVLRYLLDNGFDCDRELCSTAVQKGNLEIVQSLREHGYNDWLDAAISEGSQGA